MKAKGTPHTNRWMARPKQFSDRTTLAFPPGTFAAIAEVIPIEADRSDFIRDAVEWAIALRRSPAYSDLKAHLLANETVEEFCLKAVSRAVAQRKAALAEESVERKPPTE